MRKAKPLIAVMLLLIAQMLLVEASSQELAYEIKLGEKGVVDFLLVAGEEWALSRPLIIGYSLTVKSNTSIIAVLRLTARCGDSVSVNDYLLGLAEPWRELSGIIRAKPSLAIAACAGRDYVVLEPTLTLYVGFGRVYSYKLSPIVVKLLDSTEHVQTASCRVAVANNTALELCVETLQPWTPSSTARILLSIRSTRPLGSVAVGVKAGDWLLSSRVLDLTATNTRTWVIVGQRILAALWREDRELTLTAYVSAGNLLVEAPLKIAFRRPSVNLLIDVKPVELVAGIPNNIKITIINTGIDDITLRKIELLIDKSRSTIELDTRIPSLNSTTVKHKLLVNRTGYVDLIVRVHYVVDAGIPGVVEKKLRLRTLSPLKLVSMEPSIVEVNETVRVRVVSLVGSENATLLAQAIDGGKVVALVKGLRLDPGVESSIEFSASLEPGEYLVKLIDEHGYESNSLRLRVTSPKQTTAMPRRVELSITVTPPQSRVETGEIVEVRVVVKPPRNATFKLYRLVETPKPQWLLEPLLEVTEESTGVYRIKYKAPSTRGIYVYKLIVRADGVEREATFTLRVEEAAKTSFQLKSTHQLVSPEALLPDWALIALIGVSIAGGIALFRRYSGGE